jgi:hypothetical protein
LFCVVIIHVGVNYINNITIGLFQSCDLHKGCEEIQITNDTLQKENIPPLTWLLISIVKMTAFSLETVSVYEQQEFDVTLCFFIRFSINIWSYDVSTLSCVPLGPEGTGSWPFEHFKRVFGGNKQQTDRKINSMYKLDNTNWTFVLCI